MLYPRRSLSRYLRAGGGITGGRVAARRHPTRGALGVAAPRPSLSTDHAPLRGSFLLWQRVFRCLYEVVRCRVDLCWCECLPARLDDDASRARRGRVTFDGMTQTNSLAMQGLSIACEGIPAKPRVLVARWDRCRSREARSAQRAGCRPVATGPQRYIGSRPAAGGALRSSKARRSDVARRVRVRHSHVAIRTEEDMRYPRKSP